MRRIQYFVNLTGPQLMIINTIMIYVVPTKYFMGSFSSIVGETAKLNYYISGILSVV